VHAAARGARHAVRARPGGDGDARNCHGGSCAKRCTRKSMNVRTLADSCRLLGYAAWMAIEGAA